MGMTLVVEDGDAGMNRVDTPTWESCEAAVRAMNGDSRSHVGLMANDDNYVEVGGGGTHYVCGVRADGKLYVLYDPKKSGSETVWVNAGDGASFPENECFDVATILAVCRFFWDQKKPSQEYNWREF